MQSPSPNLETFHIEVAELPLGVIVRIEGFLGISDQAELDTQLTAVSRHRPPLVVLDFSKLEFISSVAFCVLILFRREIVQHGGTVRVAAIQPLVEEAFTVLRLHGLFDVCGTVEEAFAI